MTRARRMEPVQRLVDEREKDQAQLVARARQRVAELEARLEELGRYRQEYERGFQEAAAQGASIHRLRDFRLFLARLDEARQQQELMVTRAREELDMHTRNWHEAARRARALGAVVEKWRGEERLAAERQEQRETDERAAVIAARRIRGQD